MRRIVLPLALAALLAPSGCKDESIIIEPPTLDYCVGSSRCVINTLERAYQLRDDELFASLLANDTASNAEFRFLIDAPMDSGGASWGYGEMVRTHQRFFHPESPHPGDTPIPAELWMQHLSVDLTPIEPFAERPDLYSQDGGADGKLDPARWRAADALYSVHAFVDMAGDTDYTVDASANFVVIEDRAKKPGEPGKYFLYIWEDICPEPKPPAAQVVWPTCMSSILAMYR